MQTTNLWEKPQETEGQLQGHPAANDLGYAWLLMHYTHPSYEPLKHDAVHTHAQALWSSSEHGFCCHLPEHTTPRNTVVFIIWLSRQRCKEDFISSPNLARSEIFVMYQKLMNTNEQWMMILYSLVRVVPKDFQDTVSYDARHAHVFFSRTSSAARQGLSCKPWPWGTVSRPQASSCAQYAKELSTLSPVRVTNEARQQANLSSGI